MAYIKSLDEDRVIAVAHLGYRSDGKVVQKQKTFKRPSSVSQSRWKKSYHLTLINQWENDLKIGDSSHDDIKLDAFVQLWENQHAKSHLAPNTLASYQDNLDRFILPELGHMYLSSIKPVHIQKMINGLAERGLARRTVDYPKQILSSIMTTAERWGYISGNPCRKVTTPPIPKKSERKYYELEEIEKLMKLVQGEAIKYQAIFYLALSGGLRRSEILGIRTNDISENGVYIRKAKNDSSVRFVSLDSSTMVIIRKQQAEQEALREALGWEETWLFTKDDGDQMFRSTPTLWLKRLCQRNGITWAKLHGLRHTSATLLISSGVDIKTVSGRIGHKQTSTTINIYAHMLRDKEQAAAEILGDILHSGQKNGFYMGVEERTEKNTKEFKKAKSL